MERISRILRYLGSTLYAMGDAAEVFSAKHRQYQKRGLPSVEVIGAPINPVAAEVIDALVSQGARRNKAQTAVSRAIQVTGQSASFEDLWRQAAMEWRKAA